MSQKVTTFFFYILNLVKVQYKYKACRTLPDVISESRVFNSVTS